MPEAEPSPDSKPAPRLGSYLLVKALGSGGMSNVFRAVHEETGSVVAVKVLPRTLAKNMTLLQRFIREAKSAEALDHPNIVSIYDRGFDQGRHYLVLEYVEGRDLHDRVRLNGPLAPDEAIRFIREVAEGLRYAASQGMVHRDVKPANLLMTPDGHAKIIDLGLALQTEDEDERVTRDGTTVGTVDYMAPEQARDSRQTSERSDIYSLGCTFYYLLTGSPPYPGGGLADKLARHYKAPIPDPREHRADVSEALSLLIRKMMEKKPELRFADYTHLISVLDAVKNAPSESAEGMTLDALIVDDDDDDEIGLAPTELAISGRKGNPADRPPSTRDHIMMAEIVDDDDDDDDPPPRPKFSPKVKPTPKPSSQPRAPAGPAEISLAELAALDSDGEVATRRQERRGSGSSSSAMRTTPPSKPSVPALNAMLDDEDDEEVVGSGASGRRSSGDELPLKTWIAAGVLVGLAIAIVGFGASMIVSMSKQAEPEVVNERPEPLPFEPTTNTSTPTPRPKGPTAPIKLVKPPAKTQTVAPVVVAAPEPPAEENAYPAEWESKLFPPPLVKLASLPDKSKIVVRRILEPGDEIQSSSLGNALGKVSDLVEIADTGPFFEDDCQVAGKSRIVRGRAGFRPMIKVEFTSDETLKEQPSKFVLGGQKIDRLTLEGLDFAVDVRDLPETQQSLFFCQGAELTIRDCTITIVNGNDPKRPYRFSVFRVEEGPKPNRIVLERSTIRGSIRSLFEVGAARADLVFDRSLVVGDSGPLVLLEQNEKANRSILFHRSLAVIRGSVVEFSGKANPPVVRSLGSTFAKLEGGNTAGVFTSKLAFPGEPKSVLDWSGEDNAFVGWPAWLTSGTDLAIRVNGLDGLRSAWPGSDAKSRETLESWPITVLRDDVIPADFIPLVPDRKGTLIKIATPHPHLKELTIGSLGRLPAPELSASLIPPFMAPGSGPGMSPGMPGMPQAAAPTPVAPPQPNQTGPRLKVAPAQTKGAAASVQVQIDKTFDVNETPWTGDLGKFLADTILEGTLRATIRVRGAGVHAISPIRLPDGLSITILGDSVEGSKTPMVTFVPKPGSVGRSMIELHGGDLGLANLAFATEGKNQPKHWVRVEDSLLGIKHCRFRDPGGILPTSGALISFVARSTKPMTSRVGPFNAPTDRPTAELKNCLIWTGGEAISAEVGRGVVSLDNCLIISGGPTVSLLPQKVDADKFEADLVMERCSISFDKSAINFGPWLGGSQGPSRPWLISTRLCLFPRTQTTTTGALLQVDPGAMVRGSLFWQSSYDAYDLSRFVVLTGPQPTTAIPPADKKRHWNDLWGINHSRTVQGPDPRRSESIIRYKDKEKPKAGKVVPGALELDPKGQKELGVEFKNLPPPPKA